MSQQRRLEAPLSREEEMSKSAITTYRNGSTGETAPSHQIGTADDGRPRFQGIPGWEPVEPYEADNDGNWTGKADS
jgi:hypothetical protein